MNVRAILLAAIAAAPAFAEEAPTRLEPVVVTATRSAQGENRLPADVVVISREAIDRMGATRVVDVLRAIGGVQVADLYGDGSRATVDLRGFGDAAHSTTLILLDGRRINNTDLAPPDLSSISLKDVERIEVIRGSAGVLYGDQAVGGVINIVTRVPAGFDASLGAGGGSYRGREARGAVGQRAGGASFRLSAEARDSDNYREHNALAYRNASARLGYDGAGGGVFAELGLVDENLETPGALFANEVQQDRRQATAPFRNDYSDTHTGYLRVNFHQAVAEGWEVQTDLTHRRSNGNFVLSFASGFHGQGTQHRDLRSANPRLVGRIATGFGDNLLTAGVDAQVADYQLHSSLGPQTNQQHGLDAYVQDIQPLPAHLELTGGVRVARVRNRLYDNFTFTTPTEVGDQRSADRNFRFAKVDEYANAGAPPGSNSAALRSQTGTSYELGSEWTPGALRLGVSAYQFELRDEIAFDPTTFSNTNLDRTRRAGVGVDADWRIAGPLALGAHYHHVRAHITGGGLTGKDVPLVARDTGALTAALDLPLDLSLYAEAEGVGRRPFAGDFDNTLGRLPGYAVVNAKLAWQRGGLELLVRANNLLDAQYSEYGASAFDASFTEVESFFPSPERNFWLAARYDL